MTAFTNRLKLEYAGVNKGSEDDLVYKMLAKGSESNDVILAVGDLTRLPSDIGSGNGERLHRPVIVGGFIDKMCLSLIDGAHPHLENARHSTANNCVDKLCTVAGRPVVILSHSRAMTTYHVARRFLVDSGVRDDGWKSSIWPVIRPGCEDVSYSSFRPLIQNADGCVAYMSTDIISSSNSGSRVIWKKFYDDPDPKYSNVSMTGFFTSSRKRDLQSKLIFEFRDAVARAIDIVHSDPSAFAWALFKQQELLQKHKFHSSYPRLNEMAAALKDINGYAAGLGLSPIQLEHGLRIRSSDPEPKDCDKEAAALAQHIDSEVPQAASEKQGDPSASDQTGPAYALRSTIDTLQHDMHELRLELAGQVDKEDLFVIASRIIYLVLCAGLTLLYAGLFGEKLIEQPHIDDLLKGGLLAAALLGWWDGFRTLVPPQTLPLWGALAWLASFFTYTTILSHIYLAKGLDTFYLDLSVLGAVLSVILIRLRKNPRSLLSEISYRFTNLKARAKAIYSSWQYLWSRSRIADAYSVPCYTLPVVLAVLLIVPIAVLIYAQRFTLSSAAIALIWAMLLLSLSYFVIRSKFKLTPMP